MPLLGAAARNSRLVLWDELPYMDSTLASMKF